MHRDWANEYKILVNTQTIDSKADLNEKRQLMPSLDYFIHISQTHRNLQALLQGNLNNKMALEYLTALYLLEGKIANVMPYVELFKKLNYDHLPRHVEEAVLMFQSAQKAAGKELQKFEIRQETVLRFVELNRVILKNEKDQALLKKLLEKDFGNTLWYYIFYDFRNVKKNSLEQRRIDETIF